MVICFIALPILAVIGIFSATHRKLAWEAFDCVFRKITFRKCRSALDKRLKSRIVGSFMKRNLRIGRFIYKHFELISWIFVMLMILSLAGAVQGGVNFYLYGNCNGPVNTGFCIFDPTGHSTQVSSPSQETCSVPELVQKTLSIENFNASMFPQINKGAKSTLIFVACYICEYSKQTKPIIDELRAKKDFNFIFAHFPVKGHSLIDLQYSNCIYQADQEKFWEFNDIMFDKGGLIYNNEEQILNLIDELGLDREAIQKCALSNETIEFANKQVEEIKEAGVYGTPTVFIDGEAVVGPKPYRAYSRMIR